MNTIHIHYLCNIGPCTSGTKSSVMEFTIHKFSKELHKCFDKGNVSVCTEFLIDISRTTEKVFQHKCGHDRWIYRQQTDTAIPVNSIQL